MILSMESDLAEDSISIIETDRQNQDEQCNKVKPFHTKSNSMNKYINGSDFNLEDRKQMHMRKPRGGIEILKDDTGFLTPCPI